MEQIQKTAARKPQRRNGSCRNCSGCNRRLRDAQKEAETREAVRALYDAEAQSYYFFFVPASASRQG